MIFPRAAAARQPGGAGKAGARGKHQWLLLGALLLISAELSGCSAAATAGLGVGLNILVKGFELDTAIIENIKARHAQAPPPTSSPPPESTR